jgi:hypothetical protein
MLIIIQLTLEKQIVYVRLRSCVCSIYCDARCFFVLKYIKIIIFYLYIKII